MSSSSRRSRTSTATATSGSTPPSCSRTTARHRRQGQGQRLADRARAKRTPGADGGRLRARTVDHRRVRRRDEPPRDGAGVPLAITAPACALAPRASSRALPRGETSRRPTCRRRARSRRPPAGRLRSAVICLVFFAIMMISRSVGAARAPTLGARRLEWLVERRRTVRRWLGRRIRRGRRWGRVRRRIRRIRRRPQRWRRRRRRLVTCYCTTNNFNSTVRRSPGARETVVASRARPSRNSGSWPSPASERSSAIA